MTGNRYRREVTQYTAGRWGFTITDNQTGAIVTQGTGYTTHRSADRDSHLWIREARFNVAQPALLSTSTDQPTIATQKGLF